MPGKCLPAVVFCAGIAVEPTAANAHDEQGRAAGVAKMIAIRPNRSQARALDGSPTAQRSVTSPDGKVWMCR